MGIVEKMPWLVAVFSLGILFIESVLEVWRLKDKWILYRSTCNNLMSIQRQYAGIGKKKLDARTIDYINVVEAVINGESGQWIELSRDMKNDKDKS